MGEEKSKGNSQGEAKRATKEESREEAQKSKEAKQKAKIKEKMSDLCMDMKEIERTLMLIKPDGIKRGLIGKIIQRIEQRGLKIIALRMMFVDEQTAGRLYAEHVHKQFFSSLVDYIMSGPVVAIVLEGKNVVSVLRNMVGATDPSKAMKGTIRGDFASSVTQNTVHASDSLESAKREISIFFDESEFIE